MSKHRPRIDRDAAEQLLRGVPDSADPLATLLAAAASPPRPDELAGEEAVLVAFRAAHLGPVPQPRRRSMLKVALAKLLTLKVAGAVVAATAAGGVALAATTGNIPGVGGGNDRAASASASASAADDKADGERGKGSPSPSLVGLCHAFQAGAGNNPGKALENPAFRALISAAGDEAKVADYCTDLLASAAPDKGQGGRPSEPAGQSASHGPTAKPSAPTTGGKPTTLPSR